MYFKYFLSLICFLGDNKLCKNKKHGALFRLDDNKPQYFVQCNFGQAICRICPPTQIFNNRFQACFRRTVPVKW